jgi:branched-subunit amino acid transport protein
MSETWIVVIAVGAATIAFKAAGPVLLGGRQLPERVQSLVALLAPVMLTALIVTQTVGGDGELSLDARLPGVAAGAVAVWRRLPIVAAMAIAAAVTAAARLF